MIARYRKALLISLILIMPAMLKAEVRQPNCEQENVSPAQASSCLDTLQSKVDQELKTWLNNQQFLLEALAAETGRRGALKIFKRAQRSFTKYREDSCRWQYLSLASTQAAAIAYKKCYIKLTQARIDELSQLNK
ncbi:Uncharacterized conserved protein YecT, DUF1311 family [Colwellia chukchiensis]|uniref:Uncharacterized conserved protein YecT, DUF1311 family n=1 Tax=Colwellia chukchiensis TaxID=641665 RepID=A0A1H7NTR2_9GAMM|nr:lysozyme inhibitor LprI family protein [Colwellia chukchiensis]SEL26801.1 Uncharacterized conserved protein YecT, DUF1311 family [Colwellia chukchiensis]